MPRQNASGRTVALAAIGLTALAALAGCQQDLRDDREQPDVTVLLLEYKGPEAAASADRLVGELKAQGLEDLFIVGGDEVASVCIGRFPSWKDPRARQMLVRVRRIRDRMGQFPFAGAVLVPVPEPTPRSRWALEGAPGVFTLQVASWFEPGRKTAAVAYADKLRAEGHEAYVYHGPRFSIVTVGAFGADALEDPMSLGKPGVVPRIVSPEVVRLMEQFKYLRVEGEVQPIEGTDRKLTTGLIVIPGRDPLAAPPPPRLKYRIALTGAGRRPAHDRAMGLAHARAEVPALVAGLLRQILRDVPPDAALRIGIVAVVAQDPETAQDQAEELVVRAIQSFLDRNPRWPKVSASPPDLTRRRLEAAGVTYAQVLSEPDRMRQVPDLDMILVGTVGQPSPGEREP